MQVLGRLIYMTDPLGMKRSPVSADDRRGLEEAICSCDTCTSTGPMGTHGRLLDFLLDRNELDLRHRRGDSFMGYRCLNCWFHQASASERDLTLDTLRVRLQMTVPMPTSRTTLQTPRFVVDNRFVYEKKARRMTCDCCRADFLPASLTPGQWTDQLIFGHSDDHVEVEARPVRERGADHRAGRGDSMWFCVDCIGLWTSQSAENVMKQIYPERKTWTNLKRYHASLHLAWTDGNIRVGDPEHWTKNPLLDLVIGSERDAHQKLRDIRSSVSPGDTDLATELPKVLTVRDGPGRDDQVRQREFWIRHLNVLWADCLMNRLTREPVTRPAGYEGSDVRVLRPCFSVVDAWFVCPTCGPEQTAQVKATVHEAYCDKCHSWMEWKSATWAAEVLRRSAPSEQRKAKDRWLRSVQALDHEGPYEAANIANTLVHRKGYGSLWRYVASRAKEDPKPPRDSDGGVREFDTPEVFVNRYSPRVHRIFLLLVLEELANKRREAILAHDQDIAARGGWTPLRPPPMSSGPETDAVLAQLYEEAAAVQQTTAGEWAPSLCRGRRNTT